MDDINWPPQPNPNPFIPKKLQRELQMPHATAERELQFCTQLIQQFQQSAPFVIFSHAEKSDDLELQASPLIKHMTEINLDELNLKSYLPPCERIFQTKHIEPFHDEQAPAVSPNEKTQGGIAILKLQSLCPFKAFAEKRLHAYPLENPQPGLRASDRGNFLHTVLEKIWQELTDQSTLLSLSDVALRDLINQCIDHALHSSILPVRERTQYSIEKQRQQRPVWDWLNLKKSPGI